MVAATEFLDLARTRAFNGSRLRNLRDFFGGLLGGLSGLGVAIDDADDIGLLAEKFGPWAVTAAKFTPTPVDDQIVGWILKALESPLVRGIVYAVFFEKRVTSETTDEELLDALQSAALKAVA